MTVRARPSFEEVYTIISQVLLWRLRISILSIRVRGCMGISAQFRVLLLLSISYIQVMMRHTLPT